jgi:hypothetical protein
LSSSAISSVIASMAGQRTRCSRWCGERRCSTCFRRCRRRVYR